MNKRLPLNKLLRIRCGDIYLGARKLAGISSPHGARVLLYHSITDSPADSEWGENTVPKELFDIHLKFLSEQGYAVVSVDEVAEHVRSGAALPDRAVAITFDDGYADNYRNAFPILKKYGFVATIFITVGKLRDISGSGEFLSSSELGEMVRSGLVRAGCHGSTHISLKGLDPKALNEEISSARHRLSEITNTGVDLFAYPFGHAGSYDKNIIDTVRLAGFKGAFTSIFGINRRGGDPFTLKRNRVSWLDTGTEIKKHLTGGYDWYSAYQGLSSIAGRSV